MSSKLHPVYVALDGYQFNRAIRLCLALPKSNILGQALLAHSYAKSGQRYKSLLTLQSILGRDGYQELQLEIQYALETQQQVVHEATTSQQQQPKSSSTSKKGKKGKKKAPGNSKATVSSTSTSTSTSTSSSSAASNVSNQVMVLLDMIDSPPIINAQWEISPPPENEAIRDETTLGTLAVALQNLRLPLTVYQLYCSAASKNVRREEDFILQKAFLSGLAVISSPQYDSITTKVLSNMQKMALQLAMVQEGSNKRATSWAAQAVLWQLKLLPIGEIINDQEKKKRQMLPRLAENLASKCIRTQQDIHAEDYFLYVRSLQSQLKWQEVLFVLENDFSKEGLMLASAQKVLEQKSEVLIKLEQFQNARITYEQLLDDHPDNWTYLKGHLECSINEHNNDIEKGILKTGEIVSKILEKGKASSSHYPLRGPHLMKVELISYQLKQAEKEIPEGLMNKLAASIIQYGNEFASRVSCAFSDLRQYIDLVIEMGDIDHFETLLAWLKGMQVLPSAENIKERNSELRIYLFSIQMTLQILAEYKDLYDKWKPDWKDLVRVWKDARQKEDDGKQGETQGDELIILAVQQILYGEQDKVKLFTAAALLEMCMKQSPSNANLKITAIQVYADQIGIARCWELFKDLQIKHIQLDSCTFLILPILISGGFYCEVIELCQEILRLHASVVRDTGEFSGRAMENGTLSKAEEFIIFQRERLNRSLTALETKGVILDCAPLSYQVTKNDTWLKNANGIIGGENDYERAMQMIVEVRNPYGALSLLNITNSSFLESQISDNRDITILSHDILVRRDTATREQIINASIRRSNYHAILIRATLCKKNTKGLKKGKIIKASDELKKCCLSFQKSVKKAIEFCSQVRQVDGYLELAEAMFDLCRTIIVISAGMCQEGDILDKLESREKCATDCLKRAALKIIEAKTKLALLVDVNFATVARICRLLPDCIIPLFSVFRMCEDLMELFGLGKRKQKSKPSAEALAQLAIAFAEIIASMKFCLISLDTEQSASNHCDHLVGFSDLIDEDILHQTHTKLSNAQSESKDRVDPILTEIQSHLDGFAEDI